MTSYDPAGEAHAAGAPDRHALGRFYTPEPLVRWLWTLIDAVDPAPGTALDPACGSGRLLREAASRGARVVGIDVDQVALAVAREHLPGATLVCADALSPAGRVDPVDLLVANPPYGFRPPDAYIREQLAPFAFPESWFDVVPPHERNRGKLVEHCAWFVALADAAVREGATVALLTSNTWLSIPTWRFLRRHVLDRWTFRYVVDFNRPSDRRSVFAPDAGVAVSVVVATRSPPPPGHRVAMLDLSELPDIPSRYDAIGRCAWRDSPRDVRDLLAFEPRPPSELPWVFVSQADLRERPDARIRRPTPATDAIERAWRPLSRLATTHPGVDPGDLRFLVAPDADALRARLEPVLAGDLRGLTRTAAAWIGANLDRVGPWEPERVVPFVFQKDLRRWGWSALHRTYLHPRVQWRARLHDGAASPILATPKLLVLERRERGEVVAAVAEELVVPQHGGRLLYVTGQPEALHAWCAVLNSSAYQAFFRQAGQGDKDLPLPELASLPVGLVAALAGVSRARHQDPVLGDDGLDSLVREALAIGVDGAAGQG